MPEEETSIEIKELCPYARWEVFTKDNKSINYIYCEDKKGRDGGHTYYLTKGTICIATRLDEPISHTPTGQIDPDLIETCKSNPLNS